MDFADSLAIDYKALLKQERERMRESLAAKQVIGTQIRPPITPDSGVISMTSKSQHPERAIEAKEAINLDSFSVKTDTGEETSDLYYIPAFVTAAEAAALEQAVLSSQHSEPARWKDLEQRRLYIAGGSPHYSGMVPEPLPGYLQSLCLALVEAGVFRCGEEERPNHILLNEYRNGQGIGLHKDGDLYADKVAILSLGADADITFCKTREEFSPIGDIRPEDSVSQSEAQADDTATAVSKDTTIYDNLMSTHESVVPDKAANDTNLQGWKGRCTVRLQHCSLLVFSGRFYHDYFHGIARTSDSDISRSKTRSSGYEDSSCGSSSSSCSAAAAVLGSDCSRRLSFTARRVRRVLGEEQVVCTQAWREERTRIEQMFLQSVKETSVASSTACT